MQVYVNVFVFRGKQSSQNLDCLTNADVLISQNRALHRFYFFLCFCTVVTAEVVVEFSVIVEGPVKCALLFATVDNILCEVI